MTARLAVDIGGTFTDIAIESSESGDELFTCKVLTTTQAPEEGVFGDEYVMEKASTQAGWNTPIPSEDWSSGHLAMCEDFVTAVADGRPALSDGELGLEVTRVVYTAYLSAEQGRRVEL